MKILARGQQNQTEISEDNQCTIEKLTQTRFEELGTESASWVRIYRCINNLIFLWSHDCAWFKAEIDQSKIVAKSTRYLRDSQYNFYVIIFVSFSSDISIFLFNLTMYQIDSDKSSEDIYFLIFLSVICLFLIIFFGVVRAISFKSFSTIFLFWVYHFIFSLFVVFDNFIIFVGFFLLAAYKKKIIQYMYFFFSKYAVPFPISLNTGMIYSL